MFDAYKIGISLSLTSNAAGVLGLISQSLRQSDAEAKTLHKSLGLIGSAMTGIGVAGLTVFGKMLKPAEEYTSQLVKMSMAGMSQVDVANAVGSAWKLAGQNLTTTATGNLKALLDLRNVTGSMKEAQHFLPIMQRMQTILAASKDGGVSGHSDDLAFSAMKALDIRGAINDPARLDKQADLMTRVIIGTQGRVTPEQFQGVFNFARQAKFAMSDDFAYKILPTLMLENASKSGGGGGSRGVGPQIAALYRFTNQGFVNKKSLPLLSELGMLTGPALSTATKGTVTAPLLDAALAASNSFEWAMKFFDGHVMPYLKRHKLEASDSNVMKVINMSTRGNQLAGSLLGEYYMKKKNFERDQKLYENVQSPDEAYTNAMSRDPATARRALSAQWENFEVSLMANVAPIVVPTLMKLSTGLNLLGTWARENPDLTKKVVLGFGALSAALAIGGTLAVTTAGFQFMNKTLGGGAGLAGRLTGVANGLGAVTAAAGMFAAAYAGWKLGEVASNAVDKHIQESSGYGTSSLRDWLANSALGRATGWFDYGQNEALKFVQAPSKNVVRAHSDGFMPLPAGGMRATGPSPYVRSGSSAGGGFINNTIVMPNGQVLAKVVTEVQSKALKGPATGPRTFDPSMSPLAVGGGY